MRASVIIPTYNRADLLRRCLDCLEKQAYPLDDFEIIVVDDGSTDDTSRVVAGRSSADRMSVLRTRTRSGPAAARNLAIERARGRVVVFLDSDALAPPWFVERHVQGHEAHARIILDGPVINLHRPEEIERPPFLSTRVRCLAFLDLWGAHFVTANTSVPRDALLKAGGFDEEFVWAWEDIELGKRLENAGLRRVKDRKAYVLHCKAGPRSLPEEAALRRERALAAGLFYRKHPSRSAARAVRMRYLLYARILTRLGWGERHFAGASLAEIAGRTPRWPLFFRKLCLIHSHAEGLRKALQEDSKAPRARRGSV